MSKISELSDGGSLLPTDFLIAVRSGGNVKVQADQTEFDRIRLGDNEKIELGNSQDLSIYWDGSVGKITNSIDVTGVVEATGYLAVEGTSGNTGAAGDRWIGGDGTAGTWFYNVPTGSNHYFGVNNTNKLVVNTSGIDVTGTATMDGLTVSGTAGTLATLDRTGSNGVYLALTDNSGSNVFLGNSGGQFQVQTAGASYSSKLTVESNGDLSLYEDTGTTAKLHWSASNERLGLTGSDYQFYIQQGSNEPWYQRALSNGNYALHLNGTGDVMTFDSSGSVAVRTDTAGSPTRLSVSNGGTVQSGTAARLSFYEGATETSYIERRRDGSGVTAFVTSADDNPIVFESAGSIGEFARFDSGNLLVGKTSASSATVGFQAGQDGFVAVTRASAQPLVLNRTTSDGTILDLRRDGAVIGSIGTLLGGLYIADGGVGLRFDSGGTDDIFPCGVAGAAADASINLGSSGARFKDLYLSGDVITGGGGTSFTGEIQFVADSTRARIVGGYDSGGGGYLSFRTDTAGGSDIERVVIGNDGVLEAKYGVYLGGTAAANKLDDYEEGTWTPAVVAYNGTNPTVSSTSSGFYTKIGNLVTVSLNLDSLSVSGVTSGIMKISGLPFTPNGDAGGTYTGNQITLQRPDTSCVMIIEDGFGILSQNNGGNWAWELVSIFDGSSALRATVSYKTNS